MPKFEGNLDAAAEELQSVLDNVRPPLKGSPKRTMESPQIAVRVLESLVEELTKQGITHISLQQLRDAIIVIKGEF